jgi:hypothetical protein
MQAATIGIGKAMAITNSDDFNLRVNMKVLMRQ